MTGNLVWLQGLVANISDDGEVIQIIDGDDENDKSVVLVTSCTRSPGTASTASKGDYLQVLGQIEKCRQESAFALVRVKAVKIVNLTVASSGNVDVLRMAWPEEVEESSKFLAALE